MAITKYLYKSLLFVLLSVFVFACNKKDAPENVDQTNLVRIEINFAKPYKVMASGKASYLNKTFEKEGPQVLEFRTDENNLTLTAQTLDLTPARFDYVIYFEGKKHSSMTNAYQGSFTASIVLRKTNP